MVPYCQMCDDSCVHPDDDTGQSDCGFCGGSFAWRQRDAHYAKQKKETMKKKAKPAPPAEKTEYTVTEAAEALGCSRSSVNRQVRALGLGRMIARIHVLSPADLERVRGLVNREPGNPEWIALRKEKPVPVKKPAARKKPKGKA